MLPQGRLNLSRWVPTASMLAVSLISYIDRNTLALLAPTILEKTHLSGFQYGFVISAFSVAYTIGNPVWGRALDRFGLRLGMLAAVSLWTVASVSHGFAAGFVSFAIARALLGFGEGATFPGGLRTVMQTLEPTQYARGLAVAYSGGSLGAIITPLVVNPIAVKWGWQAGFWFTGLVGLSWLGLWLVVSRRPDVRSPIHAGASPTRAQAAPRFTDRRLWGFMLAYAFGALPIGFVLYQAAIYLNQAWGMSQAEVGKVLWIPPVGWELGYFFWGWLCDRMCRRASANPLRALRRLMAAAMLLGLPLALAPWTHSFGLVLGELFLAMFVAGGFIILAMAYATRTFSGAHSGLIAGLGAGAWSGVVALLMPLFGRLFDLHRWDAAFMFAAFSPVLGYGFWLWASRQTSDRLPI
jgi:MFS transporter, ACS family, hexuronate transporter